MGLPLKGPETANRLEGLTDLRRLSLPVLCGPDSSHHGPLPTLSLRPFYTLWSPESTMTRVRMQGLEWLSWDTAHLGGLGSWPCVQGDS